jgi:LysR family transcriptional regulator, low CO2-responsive transcriptional regulator
VSAPCRSSYPAEATQRNDRQRRTRANQLAVEEKAVYDFINGSIAADGDDCLRACSQRLPREARRRARPLRQLELERQARPTSRASQLRPCGAGPSGARGRVYDEEKWSSHSAYNSRTYVMLWGRCGMSELNFHQLRIFSVVAQHKSFSRAARELKISQPAVSAQVRQFEEDLGVVLIDRVKHRVGLTDAGRTVTSYAQRIFSIADEMIDSVESLRDLTHGRLVIGASPTIAEYVLPPLLGRFRRTHPGIELKIDIGPNKAIADSVLRNQLDMGFVGEDFKSRDLIITPFATDDMVLVAAPGHPLTETETVSRVELATLDYVLREHGSWIRRAVDELFARIEVDPTIVIELATNGAVKQAVMANIGVSILSRHAAALEIETGRLIALHAPEMERQRAFNVVYHRDKQLTGAERAFLDLVLA